MSRPAFQPDAEGAALAARNPRSNYLRRTSFSAPVRCSSFFPPGGTPGSRAGLRPAATKKSCYFYPLKAV
jgi:hypothetical protein